MELKYDMDTYKAVLMDGRKAFDELAGKYVFWAFSTERFKEGIAKLEKNLGKKCPEDFKVRDIGGGGYCVSSKAKQVCEASYGGMRAVRALMSHNAFTRGAFLYEMMNHEYPINDYQGDWDVINCFTIGEPDFAESKNYADYIREGFDSAEYDVDGIIQAYEEARSECYRRTRDWY